MPAAKDIQWQIAIAVVIAVEVAAFLVAVEGIIGGIEVNLDALAWLAMSLREQIDEQALDGLAVMVELVMAILADLRGMVPSG